RRGAAVHAGAGRLRRRRLRGSAVVTRLHRFLLTGCLLGAAIASHHAQSTPHPATAAAAGRTVNDEAARLYNQGLALWRSNQPDGATAALRRSRAALPYEAAFALGVIAARQGDLEGAAQEFARALRAREG